MQKATRVIIAGGGTAGWMTANLFAKLPTPGQFDVTLVESPDIGTIGVGEGSTPQLQRFFELIGITEEQWMPHCNATYKCNIRFEGWSPGTGPANYSHPFFSQVDSIGLRAYVANCYYRRLGYELHTHPDDFFLGSALANRQKAPLAPENFPFVTPYSYHFDSHLLGQFLAKVATERGVTHVQERIDGATRTETGDIRALQLESGSALEGDLFVDCTGFSGLLMQKTLGVPFKSFKDNLFNDSAVVMPSKRPGGELPPETRATALSAGWCWKIPLVNRYGNGYVYSSDFIDADTAETEFRRFLGTEDSEQPSRHLKMRVGQLERHWEKNCIGIGLSQGFIEPLEATALHLVQIAVEGFIRYYEEGGYSDRHRATYNQYVCEHFERVRDYIVAHYKLNSRNDSDYWTANRENQKLPSGLVEILDAWFKCQDIAKVLNNRKGVSQFDAQSWHCLLAGYGTFPKANKGPSPLGDYYENDRIAKIMQGSCLNFPDHAEALASLSAKREAN